MKHIEPPRATAFAIFLLLLLSSFSSLLFAQTEKGAQEDNTDSWFFAPGREDEKWNTVKPQRSYRVKPIFSDRYINRLETVKIEKLGWPEAQLIVGNSMDETEGYEPYLVRGLMINDGTGRFTILERGDNILVVHSGLGKFSSWHRQPLVVILPRQPEEVYTIAQTDM